MKKQTKIYSFLAVSALALAACGAEEEKTNDNAATDENETTEPAEETTITVGASYGLHDIILEEAAPILAEEGITLEVEPYQDYILPNQDLENGDLDANYFQHIPYLNNQIKEFGYDFVNIGGIHVEPMAIYSKKYTSIEEIPEGGTIIMSNSVAEQGRVLSLLESAGLITLDPAVNKSEATLDNIVENPKNLVIDAEPSPEILVSFYENEEGDAVVINSNFAIDAGISPVDDSIAIEGGASDYVNVIATTKEKENDPALKRLVEVLQSEEISDFILEEWDGAVVPVGNK
ncbi:MetQ/NlpA family ABC transporter substrate-binding protein [Caryophanon latum]|uniref:Lipoprotein n=1 Tax=Caryophanon latum TaxID=33977 RepID=A0A1C0YZC5_9BACL|nr:MetQ/NlpA family ABC transporter substrate-binding protein [Caryophanon latum]OCS92544.1 methionine ABC transporter substrate-binding protein [Caryophanon latum]